MVATHAKITARPPVPGARILIVEARFYDDIADELLRGAKGAAEAAQANVDVLTVDGALEIPSTIAIAIEAAEQRGKPYDAVVALGCVIRGETGHYDIVAGESSRALMDLSVALRIPLANGILTVENDAQAWARARVGEMNKGGGAVEAALAVLRIKRNVQGALIMAKPSERSAARLAAVQALYQMDVSGTGVSDALAEFESHWLGREVEGITFQPSDTVFFRDILEGVVKDQRAIDLKIDAALAAGWPLARIEAVLRAILRAGGYELMFRKDVPARVVISEYIDVTHGFYDQDEPGLVNAILDTLARDVRGGELDKKSAGPGKR